MSNFLAIATVTETLRALLDTGIGAEMPGIEVKTKRPEDLENASESLVNVYLYQVTPNAAYRNADLPTRDFTSQVVTRPQAALDLHYLVTFLGSDEELVPQRLLGIVARILHSHPVLTRDEINTAKNTVPYLNNSDLAKQVELVKFSPIVLNLEELSKLWSVFFQTAYRLSVAYQASVVLIESKETPRTVLPVLKPNLVVLPFHSPIIDQIISANGANFPILPNGTIVITGRNLRGDDTRVRIGGELVAPREVSNAQITLPLTLLGDKLRAGVQSVQIIHTVFSGPPLYGFESNVAAFVLRPFFTGPDVVFDAAAGEITINNITPAVGATQRVVLLLYEIVNPPGRLPNSYSFNAEARTNLSDPLKFKITNVASGDYIVRVQIDGAENIDLNQQGNFVWPTVTIAQAAQRTLTTSVAPAGSGSVARDPDKTVYNLGESVILTAAPTAGFRFVEWSGDLGNANPSEVIITVVMNQNRALTARFEAIPPNQRTLTITIDPAGSGSVARDPDKTTYDEGELVELTAVPNAGFALSEWSGDLSGSDNPATITMNSNKHVTATFTETGAVQIAFEEIQTGGASHSIVVATSANLTSAADNLYLAAIATKNFAQVTQVNGLGLTWTRVKAQCSGRNSKAVEIWRAQGTPTGNGIVTASLANAPDHAVIAVARYSGMSDVSPIGTVISGNTNGLEGACSGGSDSSAYSFNLLTTANNAVIFGVVAPRHRNYDPGAGYITRVDERQGSGGDLARIVVVEKPSPSIGSILFDGSFRGASEDWAVAALEIKPGT